MITVLSDVIAPNTLWSAGVHGRQRRKNARAEVASGEKFVNIVQSRTVREYEFGTVPLSVEQWQALEGLFEVTDAGAYGFLVLDPKDCTCQQAEGKVESAGSPVEYQLYKRYTSVGSSQYRDRKITRPILSGFVVYVSGTPTLSYSIDVTTGLIGIVGNPSPSNVAWSGRFYVPVHFQNDDIDWELTAAGAEDARYMTGPSVVLCEVKE